MNTDDSSVPTDEEWVSLGFRAVTELGGGWQSRVYAAESAAGPLAVKLTPAHLVDQRSLDTRMALVDDLARLDASVIAPVPVCRALVFPFGEWLVTATRLVEGDRVQENDLAHVELLGASLAGLHRSMRKLPAADLPRVAALRSGAGHPRDHAGSDQLLHGDFNASNLVLTATGIRIFDFDDCGYGPVEFDVANSIYMAGFDSWTKEGSMTAFTVFRAAIVSGYSRSADQMLDDAIIDSLIDVRVMAVQRWAANPSAAPIGIRDSPTEWIETLERFAREWFSKDRETTT